MLAVLNHEPGAEKLPPEVLTNATGSTVNLAEVHTKLVSWGGDPDEAWEDTLSAVHESIPFDEEQARIAGGLVSQSEPPGLTLGDRACLAPGLSLNAPVYTTNRSSKNLKVGVRIQVIR